MRRRISVLLASIRQRLGKQPRWAIAVVALASIAFSVVAFKAIQHRRTAVPVPGVPYSELAAALDAREVRDLSVEDGGTRLVATFATARPIAGATVTKVSAEVPKGAVGLADLERWSARGARVQVEGPGRLPEDPVSFVVSFVLIWSSTPLSKANRANASRSVRPPDAVVPHRRRLDTWT